MTVLGEPYIMRFSRDQKQSGLLHAILLLLHKMSVRLNDRQYHCRRALWFCYGNALVGGEAATGGDDR